MSFKTIQEYYAHIKGKVARSGCSDNWNAVKLSPSGRKNGIVLAFPLQFRDGAVLRFYETVVIDKDGNVFLPTYSYHYERSDYFFRYDRDPLYRKPVIHEECHLHANQKEPRFKTHATNFDEVFGYTC